MCTLFDCMPEKKRLYLIMLDIDGVLTEDPEKHLQRILQREIFDAPVSNIAIARLVSLNRELNQAGSKGVIALVTGRGHEGIQNDLIPLLQEHGIFDKVRIFTENGLMESTGNRRKILYQGQRFRAVRERLMRGIEQLAKSKGVDLGLYR